MAHMARSIQENFSIYLFSWNSQKIHRKYLRCSIVLSHTTFLFVFYIIYYGWRVRAWYSDWRMSTIFHFEFSNAFRWMRKSFLSYGYQTPNNFDLVSHKKFPFWGITCSWFMQINPPFDYIYNWSTKYRCWWYV